MPVDPIMFLSVAITIWKEENSTMDIMVDGPRITQIAGMLHEREIPYSIAIGDVGSVLSREQGIKYSKNNRKPNCKIFDIFTYNFNTLDK